MRSFICDEYGSAIPIILFLGGIFAAGGLYSLLFIVVALPTLSALIPDSVFKTVILGIIYFAPLIILIVGVLALLLAGMKRHPSWMQTSGGLYP